MKIETNTPVLVGAAAVQQRVEDPTRAKEAYRLMSDAVRAAAADAGSVHLLEETDVIAVPQGMWSYTDPARLVAHETGATQASTVFAEIGILQQSLIADACEKISQGDVSVAVVTGGEAKYRQLRARITGVEAPELDQQNVTADAVLKPADEIWLQAESKAGLAMPVGFYAIAASAYRAARGMTLEAYDAEVAAMYERFSDIAANNPDAWSQHKVSAEAIRTSGPKNPMLALPYNKSHNTSWNVDQAAGLIFTSAAKAVEIGVPREQWVFPLASAESNHMVPLSLRRRLDRLPGAEACARAALAAGSLSADDIDFWELYSCFPVAVQMYAREAAVPSGADLTVTGGMPFAGGPLNNYVLQATVKMTENLRQKAGSKGMVSSVSGMLTKQAYGLWSRNPGERGFVCLDLTAEVSLSSKPKELLEDYEGQATIAGYTVLFEQNEPQRGIAVVDVDAERRSVVFSEEPADVDMMLSSECVGRKIHVQAGRFRIIAGSGTSDS
ncbi:MAG: acetyl-CoA acetyltransferase [Pseudomonadota bacterium]